MAYPRYARGPPVVDKLSDLGKIVKNKGKSQKYSITTRAPIYTVVPMFPSFTQHGNQPVDRVVDGGCLREVL